MRTQALFVAAALALTACAAESTDDSASTEQGATLGDLFSSFKEGLYIGDNSVATIEQGGLGRVLNLTDDDGLLPYRCNDSLDDEDEGKGKIDKVDCKVTVEQDGADLRIKGTLGRSRKVDLRLKPAKHSAIAATYRGERNELQILSADDDDISFALKHKDKQLTTKAKASRVEGGGPLDYKTTIDKCIMRIGVTRRDGQYRADTNITCALPGEGVETGMTAGAKAP